MEYKVEFLWKMEKNQNDGTRVDNYFIIDELHESFRDVYHIILYI